MLGQAWHRSSLFRKGASSWRILLAWKHACWCHRGESLWWKTIIVESYLRGVLSSGRTTSVENYLRGELPPWRFTLVLHDYKFSRSSRTLDVHDTLSTADRRQLPQISDCQVRFVYLSRQIPRITDPRRMASILSHTFWTININGNLWESWDEIMKRQQCNIYMLHSFT